MDLDADGNIVVSAQILPSGGGFNGLVYRIDSTGTLDATFATAGAFLITDTTGSGSNDEALLIDIDGSGRIYALGESEDNGVSSIVWAFD